MKHYSPPAQVSFSLYSLPRVVFFRVSTSLITPHNSSVRYSSSAFSFSPIGYVNPLQLSLCWRVLPLPFYYRPPALSSSPPPPDENSEAGPAKSCPSSRPFSSPPLDVFGAQLLMPYHILLLPFNSFPPHLITVPPRYVHPDLGLRSLLSFPCNKRIPPLLSFQLTYSPCFSFSRGPLSEYGV